ncbi:hypothetical protein WY02_07585 [Pseudonocardia sp. AL041005-10]|nr:hypothetical protein WY02_07585 [Pseudonocardia sp. AL041005-10]
MTLTSTPAQPAHSGSRSTIAGTIASQQATTSVPGTGAPSSPTNPAGPRPPTSAPSGALVATTRSWTRVTGHRIVTCGAPATSQSRTRAQPSRSNRTAPAAWTSASKRRTPAASARAQAARTSAAPTRTPVRRRAVGATTSLLPVHHPMSGWAARAGPRRTPPSRVPSASWASRTTTRGSASWSSRSAVGRSGNSPCSTQNTARRSARYPATPESPASSARASRIVTGGVSVPATGRPPSSSSAIQRGAGVR